MSATYRVDRKTFGNLADARAEAENQMTGRHDDDYVMIEKRDEGEDFFEPYKRIERDGGRFVLR